MQDVSKIPVIMLMLMLITMMMIVMMMMMIMIMMMMIGMMLMMIMSRIAAQMSEESKIPRNTKSHSSAFSESLL